VLLHRDVVVTVEGIDKANNFFGSVVDSEGRNVSLSLLNMGLANFVEWSANKATAAQFRFKNVVKLPEKPSDSKSGKGQRNENEAGKQETFNARVVEIVNVGTITVRFDKGGRSVDRKISFSSIRVPRLLTAAEQEEGKLSSSKDENEEKPKLNAEEQRWESSFALEAKEYLRALLIGKKVRCVFDYVRPSFLSRDDRNKSEMVPPKPFWSVYLGDANIAVELVKRGYARVVPHTLDQPRSPAFQDLIIAEKAAIKLNAGLHGPKSRKSSHHHYNDLTVKVDRNGNNNKKTIEPKCQQFLNYLIRAGNIQGVVDYVFSGSKLRLSLPSKDCVICFVLQACTTQPPQRENSAVLQKKGQDISIYKLYPQTKNSPEGKKEDIYGNIALHHARDTLFQRNVEVEITRLDKGCNFLGSLTYTNEKGQKVDYALELIQLGHARINLMGIEKIKNRVKYEQAEAAAKKQRLGIWSEWDEEVEKQKILQRDLEREEKREQQASEPQRVELTITEILNGSEFYFQYSGENSVALEELMEDFKNYDWVSLPKFTPSIKGELVAAQFTHDDNWYRAQITRIPKDSEENTQYEVFYIDYGNKETLRANRLRRLPEDYGLDLLPAQAHKGKLAYVDCPKLEAEFGRDAAACLKELVWEQSLVATIQFEYDGTSHLV